MFCAVFGGRTTLDGVEDGVARKSDRVGKKARPDPESDDSESDRKTTTTEGVHRPGCCVPDADNPVFSRLANQAEQKARPDPDAET
jgi:hypothetical protein